MSSVDEHIIRRCKFQNGKSKTIKAHIRIKNKKLGVRLSVQPLVEGYPEGDPLKIMLYEMNDLYIESASPDAHHLCIEGIVKSELYDKEIDINIIRIKIYKNQSNQPDPQATYALFEYLKSRLNLL